MSAPGSQPYSLTPCASSSYRASLAATAKWSERLSDKVSYEAYCKSFTSIQSIRFCGAHDGCVGDPWCGTNPNRLACSVISQLKSPASTVGELRDDRASFTKRNSCLCGSRRSQSR